MGGASEAPEGRRPCRENPGKRTLEEGLARKLDPPEPCVLFARQVLRGERKRSPQILRPQPSSEIGRSTRIPDVPVPYRKCNRARFIYPL